MDISTLKEGGPPLEQCRSGDAHARTTTLLRSTRVRMRDAGERARIMLFSVEARILVSAPLSSVERFSARK